MSDESEEVKVHDTHRILNIIGEDIFKCETSSDMKTKLVAYERCISEIRERVDNEIEASVESFWRGRI